MSEVFAVSRIIETSCHGEECGSIQHTTHKRVPTVLYKSIYPPPPPTSVIEVAVISEARAFIGTHVHTHSGSRYFLVAPRGQPTLRMDRVIQTSQSSQCLCLTFDYFLVLGRLGVIIKTDYLTFRIFDEENGKIFKHIV